MFYKTISLFVIVTFVIACSSTHHKDEELPIVEGHGSSSTWEAELITNHEASGERTYSMELRFKEDTDRLMGYEIEMNGRLQSSSPGNNPTPKHIDIMILNWKTPINSTSLGGMIMEMNILRILLLQWRRFELKRKQWSP